MATDLTADLACHWCGFSFIGHSLPSDGRCPNQIYTGNDGGEIVQCGQLLRLPRGRSVNVNRNGIVQGWA